MTAPTEKRRPGRPRGSGAKGGVRHSVRISDYADAKVKAEVQASTTKTTVSDVIGAIVEDWARTRDSKERRG